MAIPLIVLAIGSIFAGYAGVPQALGGSNRIEHFLEPSFEAHAVAGEAAEPAAVAPFEATTQEAHGAEETQLEVLLMGVSSGIAVAGIGLAFFFWVRRPQVPARLATQFAGLYTFLLDKWYIDEIYNALIVQPIKQFSTAGLWKGVDVGIIDGTVNGIGALVASASSVLRRLQTGSIRTYAASFVFGTLLIVGWYL